MSKLGNLSNFIDENWYGGQIEGDFFSHPEMNIEENLRVAKTKKASIWNWKHAVIRELMRGHHKKDIIFKYQDIINKFNLQDKINAFLNKYDGILGYFIVDVSNFDSKFTYDNIPSFMKECNLYAINATELREIISRSLVSENDGSFDGFMNANDNIQEEIHYVDEYTGLPCIDNIEIDIDNEDERLDKIADLFLNKKIITIGERSNFNKIENKFKFLVDALKKSFTLKSTSLNNKVENDVSNYNLQNYNLQADSQKSHKNVDIKNLKENKIDDIGNVKMPEKVEIKQEKKKSDLKQDVKFDKKVKPEKIDKLKENKIGDIEEIKIPEKIEIQEEKKKSDFKPDIELDEKIKYEIVNDNIHELSKKDFKDDVIFNNTENFVIEDIKDMKDDEFDYADLSKGDVNLNEMFVLESDKKELDVDEQQEDFEIDGKSDWTIDI